MEDYHLDIGQIQENDDWFELIDTSCPFCQHGEKTIICEKCNGEGEYACPEHEGNEAEAKGCDNPDCEDGLIGCEECKGLGTIDSDETCEECDGNGNFEIMWNTAFRIPYLKTGLSFEEAKKIAWQKGWLLFEYENDLWIASGSCGYDFTWVKASCAFKLMGSADLYYIDQMSNGGEVFLHNPQEKIALLEAAVEELGYAINRYQRQQIEYRDMRFKIEFDIKMKQEASHMTKIEES